MTDTRKSRFTEQRIIGFLKQVESGLLIKDVYRQGGFSEPPVRQVTRQVRWCAGR